MNDAAGGDQPSPYPLGHPSGAEPDVERLALDTADPDHRPAEVADHLQDCAPCRAVVAALDSVRAELRAQTTPMPAAVALRLEVALRHEASGSDGVRPAEAAAGRHRATDTDDFAVVWRRRRLRSLATVAAGVIVLGGSGYLVVDGLGDSGGDTVDAGASRGESSILDATSDDELPTYNRASLRAGVGELLADQTLTPASDGGAESEAAVTAVERDCVAGLPVATGAALSITRAVYAGQPAIIVVFAGAPGRVQVTVLSDCTDGDPQVLDEFEADR